ncbi:polymorphic toxin-type HINT domain-containing protein [Streptomyces sp. V4I2]|uniref:polymorphic toxin-type HINT domain-containing protein n=1 Tax=Streptomyces sp. V4I2 TaxID=3042280 RepID=UPI00278633B8|nr:polymorphic toxin-type HINT domain-containing protein [Streptomyces sp. V4I2]MDQ1045374.1 hypothetical protein [Streptomyces sp. V4I2]
MDGFGRPRTAMNETVTAEITGKGQKDLVRISLSIESGGEKRIASVTGTAGHPFCVPELGPWVDATDLSTGAELKARHGVVVRVVGIQRWTQALTVHNLTVVDTHTYYVMAGTAPVLVHNCDGDIHWVKENANMSQAARKYDSGALGSQVGKAPALQCYKAGGKRLSTVKFDGMDATNGVMIERELNVTGYKKTYRQAQNQSLLLEQNGLTGVWEVPDMSVAAQARKILGR